MGAPGLQKKVHKGLDALTWCRGLRSRRGGAVGLRFMTWAPNIQGSLKESLCATPVGKTEGSLGTRAQAFDFEGLQGRCFFLFLLVFRPTVEGLDAILGQLDVRGDFKQKALRPNPKP